MEQIYQGVDSVHLYENSSVSFGMQGTQGRTEFTHKKMNPLSIEYQYISRPILVLNRIWVNRTSFPKSYNNIDQLKSKISERGLSLVDKYESYKELIELLNPVEGEEMNYFAIPSSGKYLSTLYGNLSWYDLLLGKNEDALKSAQTGLELHPFSYYINTNLALAYAQVGDSEKAIEVYSKFKDEPYKNNTYKDVFIGDLEALEKKGIEVKIKSEILKILNE